MADLTKPVTLANGGNTVGVGRGDGLVFGYFYVTQTRTTWNFTEVDGGYQIQDALTGNYLAMVPGYADDDSDGPSYFGKPQVVAKSADPNTPNAVWVIAPVDAEDDEYDNQVEDYDEDYDENDVAHSVYTVSLAGSDSYLGRSVVEDRSLGPKPIVLGDSADDVQEFWTFQQ
ncbi:hypothetical protein [Streptacidiphilus sp. EB129]|uniref:hypothetical protein n=1 Tax=Streptacidiphilus sp. EB129 TaxID=3156262 RepID=UPI003513D85B